MNIAKKKILILILLAACSKPLPQFNNIDLAKWRNDKKGCRGDRLLLRDSLQHQLEKIKGLSENDVLKLFGRPDQNELWKRNQKFYHYFLAPSTSCDSPKAHTQKLSIRFNAMDLANEVEIK